MVKMNLYHNHAGINRPLRTRTGYVMSLLISMDIDSSGSKGTKRYRVCIHSSKKADFIEFHISTGGPPLGK